MRLDSFTVGYSLTEDRLLLQAVGDGEPQSFWITRKAALMIGEGIQKVLIEHYHKFGAHKISYTAENADACVITLTDSDGKGHGYRLQTDMLHALLNLIQSQCDQAGWGVKLTQPTPAYRNLEFLH